MLLLLREYASTYIHPFPSPEPSKNILLLIRERIAKNISIFPLCNKCSIYIGYYHLLYYLKRWVLYKKKIRGNKKGQVPGTSKEMTRGKNRQVSDNRIRGTRYPPERREKYIYIYIYMYIEHLILLNKVSKEQERYVPPQRAKVELDFHHCYHHHHHTPFIRHTCTSWFDLLICFFGFMVWLYNKYLVSMYTLSSTYKLQILKPY